MSSDKFFETRKGSLPRFDCRKAVEYHVINKGSALDLGAGTLNDTNFLIEKGFDTVTVVDNDPAVASFVEQSKYKDKINLHNISMEAYEFPKGTFDLVNAQFCFHNLEKTNFYTMWPELVDSLRKEGIFTGIFFGEYHEWFKQEKSFFTSDEVKQLFDDNDFEVLKFLDEQHEHLAGNTGLPVHVHIFHVIARKK